MTLKMIGPRTELETQIHGQKKEEELSVELALKER
jgi:hypothetical protein